MVDGFISALHTHDGSQLEVVAERLGARLDVPGEGVAQLLSTNTAGVLGLRRLLLPFRDYVQWNPADDIIGCFGYGRRRRPGGSSAHRLSLRSWTAVVTPGETFGRNPRSRRFSSGANKQHRPSILFGPARPLRSSLERSAVAAKAARVGRGKLDE